MIFPYYDLNIIHVFTMFICVLSIKFNFAKAFYKQKIIVNFPKFNNTKNYRVTVNG